MSKQLFHRPGMICNTGSHSGSALNRLSGFRRFDFERGMRAAEVEMSNLQSNGATMIPHDFAIAKRLAGESAVKEPHAQVHAFQVVYGHSGAIRTADLRDAFNPLEFDWDFHVEKGMGRNWLRRSV
jgi:hypothetical protein